MSKISILLDKYFKRTKNIEKLNEYLDDDFNMPYPKLETNYKNIKHINIEQYDKTETEPNYSMGTNDNIEIQQEIIEEPLKELIDIDTLVENIIEDLPYKNNELILVYNDNLNKIFLGLHDKPISFEEDLSFLDKIDTSYLLPLTDNNLQGDLYVYEIDENEYEELIKTEGITRLNF